MGIEGRCSECEALKIGKYSKEISACCSYLLLLPFWNQRFRFYSSFGDGGPCTDKYERNINNDEQEISHLCLGVCMFLLASIPKKDTPS